jgi:regulatory associated protein of mTOR
VRLWGSDFGMQEISTGSESMITSIAFGPSHTFITSSGDGTIRLYDRRVDKNSPVVATLSGHSCWVQNVRWQAGGHNLIMSARYTYHYSIGLNDC